MKSEEYENARVNLLDSLNEMKELLEVLLKEKETKFQEFKEELNENKGNSLEERNKIVHKSNREGIQRDRLQKIIPKIEDMIGEFERFDSSF